MKIKYLLITMIVIMFTFTVSAQMQDLGIVKQGTSVNLIQNCLDSTYSNISRIMYPNKSFAINVQTTMTKNGDDYSYIYSDTDALGEYSVYGVCDQSGTNTNWVYTFEVKARGDDQDEGVTELMIMSLIALIVIIFSYLYISRVVGSMGLFILGFGVLFANPNNGWVGWIIIAIGFISLLHTLLETPSKRKRRRRF